MCFRKGSLRVIFIRFEDADLSVLGRFLFLEFRFGGYGKVGVLREVFLYKWLFDK